MITGIFAALAFCNAGIIALPSIGATTIPSTPLLMAFSIFSTCLDTVNSSPERVNSNLKPADSTAFWHSSTITRWNSLFVMVLVLNTMVPFSEPPPAEPAALPPPVTSCCGVPHPVRPKVSPAANSRAIILPFFMIHAPFDDNK